MTAGAVVEGTEIVRLFGRYECLIDPALLESLARRNDPQGHAERVLAAMHEVPFYLTLAAFQETEARLADADAASPGDDGPMAVETEEDPGVLAARKAALARMLELVYDAPGAAGEARDDSELDGATEAGPTADGQVLLQRPVFERPRVTVNRSSTWRPLAAEYESELKILQDITGNSTCEGTTGDFHKYFKSRFQQMERLLRKRRELANATTVDRALDGAAQEVSLIGLVTENRTTANGNRFIMLEDETGRVPCIVPVHNEKTDKAVIARSMMLVPDEVIGVVAQKATRGDGGLLIVRDLIRPDVPYDHEQVRSEIPLGVAVLSDIHVGNELFLEKNFRQMLKWLNGEIGNTREREMAGRIKYLLCPGDMVDGVGIYPGQEHNLAIEDIYDQYAYLGGLLEAVPDHIQIIVQPGNHDAARPVEPQPALDQEVRSKFDPVEAAYVGNPSLFTLHGVRVLSYHGCSLMDFATAVQKLEHHDPLPIMEEMMKCRHLAPIYGQSTPLAPEHKDYMVIETVPELFVTGHVHTFNTRNYRGVQLVNSSTWQSQTDYQRMLNMRPDPAILPIFDLKSLRTTSMDFQMGMDFSYRGAMKT